jgi:branched-chain amino acid transport system substrate-binding protein
MAISGTKRLRGSLVLGVFLALAGFLAVSLSPVHLKYAEARDIKVGIIDCYSGPPAVYGNDALNGFKLALEEINKEGVLGGKITWTNRDTKFKVDIALNMAKELVMREGVDLLVGTINSGAAMAVSTAVAQKEKIPFFVWISKSERITGEKGHRYVFSTGENSAMAGKAGGVALSREPYVRYWIAGDDYEYGHSLAEAAWRNLKARKPEVETIGKSWWKPGEADLSPYITSIMSAKPDAVIFCTGGASMTNVLKAIKATGMAEKLPVYIHTATDHAVLKPLGEQAPEGVMGTMDYHFYYPETPEHMAFVDKFRKAYGEPPGFSAFHGYITAHFIAEGYRRAGTLDTEKFIDAVEGLVIDSPVGPLEMRACDHQVKLPMYLGVTRVSQEHGVAISTDIVTLSGEEVMPTCEEIMKARGR